MGIAALHNRYKPVRLVPGVPHVEHPFLNFSRPSPKNCFGPDGTLIEYAADEIPYEWDPVTGIFKGRLFEEERTNEILDSRDMTTGNWRKIGIGNRNKNADGVDGVTNSAVELDDQDPDTPYRIDQSVSVLDDDSIHVASVFIKKTNDKNTYPVLRATLEGGTPKRADLGVNTNDGSSGFVIGEGNVHDYNVEDYGDWWFCWIAIQNNNSGNTSMSIVLVPAETSDFSSVDSSLIGSAIFDQAQVELNASSPTSPIITQGAAVTRNADDANFTNLSWYNQREGAFVVEFKMLDTEPQTNENLLYANSGILFLRRGWGRDYRYSDDNGNSGTLFSVSDNSEYQKIALAYDEGLIIGLYNGNLGNEESWNPSTTINKLNFGNQEPLYIRSLHYYPFRIPNQKSKGFTKQLS